MGSRQARIVIAGTETGVGKTMISLGLMAALQNRGYKVQGFKVGPDYVDPSYHTMITQRPSRNLDTWLLPGEIMQEVFLRGSRGADISIIEGVMGLYDGKSPDSDKGSTAEVAEKLGAPVLLVMNAGGMARSAAAVVLGYQRLNPHLRLAGVILNRIGGEGHYLLLKTAIEQECRVPVVGWLPEEKDLIHPKDFSVSGFSPLVELIEKRLDLSQIVRWAEQGTSLSHPSSPVFVKQDSVQGEPVIAVAQDAAFNFYYPDNLDLLRLYGGKTVFFSPLAGEIIPSDADGVWIGGCLPEIHLSRLSEEIKVQASFRKRLKEGMPTFAECGGYLYLSRGVIDRDNRFHPMVGAIPGIARLKNKLVTMGYREVRAFRDTILLKQGEKARGHQFRYSTMEIDTCGYETRLQNEWYREGYAEDNLLASYTHLHLASNPQSVIRFLNSCRQFRQSRQQSSRCRN